MVRISSVFVGRSARLCVDASSPARTFGHAARVCERNALPLAPTSPPVFRM
jgi:hypothetical protein